MTDLHWLAATCLLTALFWLTYVLRRILVRGLFKAMDNPDPEAEPATGWTVRAKAAHQNATENLVVFAPLVLIAFSLGLSGPVTAACAQVYFFARLVHFAVYTAGIPVVRTLAFAAGWFATLGLVGVVFGLWG